MGRFRFNPLYEDCFQVLGLPQPYADRVAGKDALSETRIIQAKDTKYRGDVLICATSSPLIEDRKSGVTIGYAELVDVAKISSLSKAKQQAIGIEDSKKMGKYYVWTFRKPRRVIEIPYPCGQGFDREVFPKGEIMEYPKALSIDAEGWETIKNQIKK